MVTETASVDRVVKKVNELVRVSIECKGKTPLLMNRVSDEELLKIRDKIKEPKGAPRKSPREECEGKVYKDLDGKPYIPIKWLYSCLVAAGQHVRLDGKRQISTATKTMLPQFLTLDSETIKLITPHPWEVDLQQGRNPNGGELVVLCRPRFDAWGFQVDVSIDTREIAEGTIRELFDKAGVRCGLGDFRPARKGIYGQFIVDCWKRH